MTYIRFAIYTTYHLLSASLSMVIELTMQLWLLQAKLIITNKDYIFL